MDELDRRIAALRRPGRRPVVELIDEEMVPIFAAMSGAERLALAFSMAESARSMLDAYLRSQHPDWDDEDIEREIVRRFAGGAT
jgi:Rv0078B-related antitoxin